MMRKTTYHSLKCVCIALVILVVVLVVSSLKHYRFDLTEEKRYTLHPETEKVLQKLPDTIRFTVYLDGDLPMSFVKMRREISDLLIEFQEKAGSLCLVKFIDPQTIGDKKNYKHTISRLYESYNLKPYTIQEQEDDGKTTQRVIIPGIIASTSKSFVTINLFDNAIGNTSEEQINSALQNLEFQCIKAITQLTSKERKNIAFLRGHGETSLLYTYDATVSLLDLYNVDRITTKELADSSSKYDAIIIVEPTEAYSEEDKYIIDQYVMNNGNVMILTDMVSVSMDSLTTKSYTYAFPKELQLSDLLFNWGVRIAPTILLDNQCAKIPMNVSTFGDQPRFEPVPWYYFPLFRPNQSHIITKNIDVIKGCFASTIDTIQGNAHFKKSILLSSSMYARVIATPNSVGFQVLDEVPDMNFFNAYSVPTAVLLEGNCRSLYSSRKAPTELKSQRKDSSEQNRIIVVSDGDIIRNEIQVTNNDTVPKPLYFYKYFSFDKRIYRGNGEFFINAVNYLCGDSDLLSVRSREITIRLLNKNKISEERRFWQLLNVTIPIIFIASVGMIIFFVRKRKNTKQYAI